MSKPDHNWVFNWQIRLSMVERFERAVVSLGFVFDGVVYLCTLTFLMPLVSRHLLDWVIGRRGERYYAEKEAEAGGDA